MDLMCQLIGFNEVSDVLCPLLYAFIMISEALAPVPQSYSSIVLTNIYIVCLSVPSDTNSIIYWYINLLYYIKDCLYHSCILIMRSLIMTKLLKSNLEINSFAIKLGYSFFITLAQSKTQHNFFREAIKITKTHKQMKTCLSVVQSYIPNSKKTIVTCFKGIVIGIKVAIVYTYTDSIRFE